MRTRIGWRGAERMRLALGAGLLLWLHACAADSPTAEPAAYPSAGLYTPGNVLGASDPTDSLLRGMGLGDRCVSFATGVDAGIATAGTLRVEYSTRTADGRYAPKNCTAAWIETADGLYVATIEIGAALRRPGLLYWQDHACTEKPGPDVISSATLPDHTKPHKPVWKGLDLDKLPVPDGNYRLFIEVTESDKEPGEYATFDFVKSPLAFRGEVPVPAEGLLDRVSIAWELSAAGGVSGAGK